MQIHLSRRTRGFTVLGNDLIRDKRLSFTARGILGYLLSLPSGAREDVRSLADNNPGVGRRGVSKAVDELIRYGYYVRETVRDAMTGQARTKVSVFDTPYGEGEPVPVLPAAGEPIDGNAGGFPLRAKQKEEEKPSLPEPVKLTEAAGRGGELLRRLGVYEPRPALSAAEILVLAPLAERWVEHGVPELEARSLLADGLPRPVHSARALPADRLVRKLPAPRARRDPAAPAASLPECPSCRDPLAAPDTPCTACAQAPTPPPRHTPLPPEAVAAHADEARRALRGIPAPV
ncbi:hypothetical protein [Streptomyces sp. NPDC058279]|uniref:hypothetical protein n=1 Tax=Streptomyces sp. NPDC058279 TaxID=3346418 RepID=UPI0036E20100